MRIETLGSRIRRLRMERGWTAGQLSTKLGRKYRYIQFMEADAFEPFPEDLEKLADAFGETLHYIKTGDKTGLVAEGALTRKERLVALSDADLSAIAEARGGVECQRCHHFNPIPVPAKCAECSDQLGFD